MSCSGWFRSGPGFYAGEAEHHGKLAGICSVSGIILPALTPEGRSPWEAASKAAQGEGAERGEGNPTPELLRLRRLRGCLCLEVRGKAREFGE